MNPTPKWYMPVCIVALLWNLLGCSAYLMEVMMKAEDIAKLPADQQALYASRPAWFLAAMAIGVWGGALGCIALIMKRRWALPVLIVSLLGLIVQDIGLYMVLSKQSQAATVPLILQSLVIVIAIALMLLARRANASGWTK